MKYIALCFRHEVPFAKKLFKLDRKAKTLKFSGGHELLYCLGRKKDGSLCGKQTRVGCHITNKHFAALFPEAQK